MTDNEIFKDKVIPVMDRVRADLQHKQAMEAMKHNTSLGNLISGGIGPDGGMAAHAASLDSLKITGEWNSKTVEDYVQMVKDELVKEKVDVTPELESMMIDKMVQDRMPKSSIEYIMRKAAGNTLFGFANEAGRSPLEAEIEAKGEELYGPTKLEKGIGWGLGAAADFVTMGGSGLGAGLMFVGTDIAVNAAVEKSQQKNEIPLVIKPGYEEQWLADQKKASEKKEEPVPEEVKPNDEPEKIQEAPERIEVTPEPASPEIQEQPTVQTQPQQSNTNGWNGVLSSFGLNGMSDIGRNAGYILAMLPDILVGVLTGRTQSLGLKENMMPIASIIAGMFVKNPLLKMTLIGLGGANLLNKAGHEELARRDGVQTVAATQYRQYGEEALNPRIDSPLIQGNTLIASIDRIPVTVSLPPKVIDAYNQGALPLSTLANAVLQRCDQMQQMTSAQERFEQESRSEVKALTQR